MTDNEIIKALECCAVHGLLKCEKCPKKNEGVTCMYALSKDALDLIKRKDAEIEQWKEEANKYQNNWCESVKEIERLKNAGDNKTKELLRLNSTIEELHEKIKTATIEAIKEFAERAKSECEGGWLEIQESVFDNLVKEMTE